MKIKSIKHLTFQRNGTSGDSFYHCVVETHEDKGLSFVCTFETDPDDRLIDHTSCRVFCLEEPTEKWRGDEFGRAIMEFIKRDPRQFIYDHINMAIL